MSETAMAVLQSQNQELNRKISELQIVNKQGREKRRELVSQIEALKAEKDDLSKQLQESVEAMGDVETLYKTIEEWEPLVEAYQQHEPNLTAVTAERDDLQSKFADLQKRFDTVSTEYESARAQLALPTDEANQKYREATGRLARYEHERAFKEAMANWHDDQKNQLAPNDAVTLDRIWGELGYVPEGDAPDPTMATERLTEARAKAPFLFRSLPNGPGGGAKGADTVPKEQPEPRPPVAPGPGIPRGTPARESGVLNASDMLGHRGKVMTSADQKAFYEHHQGKTLREPLMQPPPQPRRR